MQFLWGGCCSWLGFRFFFFLFHKQITERGAEAADALSASTRTLLKIFREQEDVPRKLHALIPGDPSAGLSNFVKTFIELKNVTYHKLLSTVEEERSRQDFLAELVARERKATSELKTLQQDLSEEHRARDNLLAQKNATISALKSEIHDIQSSLGVEARLLEQEYSANEEADRTTHNENLAQLTAEITRLKGELAGKTSDDRESETSLRNKLHHREQEVENWIQKYDQEMDEKEQERASLQAIYDADKAALQHLQSQYDQMLKDQAELRASEEKRMTQIAAIEAEKKRLNDAARTIQLWWRSMHVPKKKKKKRGKSSKSKTRTGGATRRTTSAKPKSTSAAKRVSTTKKTVSRRSVTASKSTLSSSASKPKVGVAAEGGPAHMDTLVMKMVSGMKDEVVTDDGSTASVPSTAPVHITAAGSASVASLGTAAKTA